MYTLNLTGEPAVISVRTYTSPQIGTPTATSSVTATRTPTPGTGPTLTRTPTSNVATPTRTPTLTGTPGSLPGIHVGDLDGNVDVNGQTWRAIVTITVHNSNHQPVANATIVGHWGNGYTGTALCVTNSTGSCMLETGRADRDAALESYNEALKLFKAVGAKLGEANVYMSLGDFNLGNEKWNDAIESYERALPIYRSIQAQLGQANTLIDLGKAYFEIGEHDKGMEYVREAGDTFAKIGSGYWAIRAYRRLVEMLKQCDRVEEAKDLDDQLNEIEKRS